VHSSNNERRTVLPILKAPSKQSKNESVQLRVPAEFKHNLQRYAQFLNASPSYVVVQALNRIFEKDRDFKEWLEDHPDAACESEAELELSMEATRKS
jgi:hypothetical protein